MTVAENRNVAIDVLKFVAVFLITNHHFGKMWPSYEFMATGGILGNALFFFCSGYTLALRPLGGFDDWYGRRVSRILPSLIAWSLLLGVFFNCATSVRSVFLFQSGGWFIKTIAVFYILYWMALRFERVLGWLTLVVGLATLAWYYIMDWSMIDFSAYSARPWMSLDAGLYNAGRYFFVMLLGAWLCKSRTKNCIDKTNSLRTPLGVWVGSGVVILSLCIYFILAHGPQVITIFTGKTALATQLGMAMNGLMIFSAAMFCVGFYFFCSALQEHAKKSYLRVPILFVGGLCLDVYLVHLRFITDAYNNIFPFNFVVVYLIVFTVAYLNRSLGRLVVMTFARQGYSWREIFKPW